MSCKRGKEEDRFLLRPSRSIKSFKIPIRNPIFQSPPQPQPQSKSKFHSKVRKSKSPVSDHNILAQPLFFLPSSSPLQSSPAQPSAAKTPPSIRSKNVPNPLISFRDYLAQISIGRHVANARRFIAALAGRQGSPQIARARAGGDVGCVQATVTPLAIVVPLAQLVVQRYVVQVLRRELC